MWLSFYKTWMLQWQFFIKVSPVTVLCKFATVRSPGRWHVIVAETFYYRHYMQLRFELTQFLQGERTHCPFVFKIYRLSMQQLQSLFVAKKILGNFVYATKFSRSPRYGTAGLFLMGLYVITFWSIYYFQVLSPGQLINVCLCFVLIKHVINQS